MLLVTVTVLFFVFFLFFALTDFFRLLSVKSWGIHSAGKLVKNHRDIWLENTVKRQPCRGTFPVLGGHFVFLCTMCTFGRIRTKKNMYSKKLSSGKRQTENSVKIFFALFSKLIYKFLAYSFKHSFKIQKIKKNKINHH